jgi:uncharacterized protein YkwD
MKHRSKTFVHRLAGVVATLLLAFGPALTVTAPAAQAYTPSKGTIAAYEARVIYQMNVQRTRYGRAKLAANSCPDKYAESWAAYLARTGYFYHRSMQTILAGCKTTLAGEVLARGNVSADRVVSAWMASPSHRRVILNGRQTRTGVAAVYARGQWTVAANFIRR